MWMPRCRITGRDEILSFVTLPTRTIKEQVDGVIYGGCSSFHVIIRIESGEQKHSSEDPIALEEIIETHMDEKRIDDISKSVILGILFNLQRAR